MTGHPVTPLMPTHLELLARAREDATRIGQELARARAAGIAVEQHELEHNQLVQKLQLIHQHYGQASI